MHDDDRVEEASGKFTNQRSDVDMTKFEFGMTFLQMKASTTI
jgi:hypothetical protein